MKSDPVQEFILQSEQNLRIAVAVTEAWPEARKQLLEGFVDRLEVRLKQKLTGWKSERWDGDRNDGYLSFYLWKPAWQAQFKQPQYYIHLEVVGGQRTAFGLARNDGLKHLKSRGPSWDALAAVTKSNPSAKVKPWWEAKIWMESPAADWSAPAVLWRMHQDPKLLEEVATQLLEVADVSEAVVDRLVQSK